MNDQTQEMREYIKFWTKFSQKAGIYQKYGVEKCLKDDPETKFVNLA